LTESKKNQNINKNLKKMMVNLNTLLNKKIESLKDPQEIKKNPNILLNKETQKSKKDHKNQEVTI